MKIAIDIQEAGKEKAGKGWYTYHLVCEILKNDRDNQYILYASNEDGPFSQFKNADVKVLKKSTWQWHLKVLKDIRAQKVDLFFAPTSYIIPSLAPKELTTVMTVHDLVAFLFPKTHNRKARLLEKLTLKKALKKTKAVLAVSMNTKNDLLKHFSYPEEKIHLIPCAASEVFKKIPTLEELKEVKNRLGFPEHFILSVGTLEPRKNLPAVLKSFSIIQKKYPAYKLVIVGKKGWHYDEIQKALQESNLDKNVIFTGYLPESDLHKVYSQATIFVFPSLYEGFGIPPLEAMMSGCPVIASNRASLPEVIGDAGILVDPMQPQLLANAIDQLLSNQNLRNEFIKKGKQQAEKFTWQSSARKAIEVFNSLQ